MGIVSKVCFFTLFILVEVQAFSAEALPRKRLGKKSFIQKQERGEIQNIATPQELYDLAQKYSDRKPGSASYRRAWKHWCVEAISAIRYDLSQNLPYPADKSKFEHLFYNLGVAADNGVMPSFEDRSARSGYALEFFNRSRDLADLFFDLYNPMYNFSDTWTEAIVDSPMLKYNDRREKSFKVISLGGGPAYDFVAVALASAFSANGRTIGHHIEGKIFDYETGWSDLVEAMGHSSRRALNQPKMNCEWGGKCDITRSLTDANNENLNVEIYDCQVIICQYCIAENAQLLRESNFIFFKELFQKAAPNTCFILSETTPRLWSEFYELIKTNIPEIQVDFYKSGRQMLLVKKHVDYETSLSKEDGLKLIEFERIAKDHEKKIKLGWERQSMKVKGV
ncbi:hypothetical protein CTEN210_15332 [Chaetoceros tenuissimus]|uniref:Uncharacterized protein n=1 Tax=Chaetoceros tenuissimus TaxID=426638 RepID=A0AAD3D6Q3_9STRA|nr:hypothetical protein CTEN210_15332 [Chaetoceros tenuissimus]